MSIEHHDLVHELPEHREKIHSMKTVSYTHLDVYKRQHHFS